MELMSIRMSILYKYSLRYFEYQVVALIIELIELFSF
jgi:hypothetical protein